MARVGMGGVLRHLVRLRLPLALTGFFLAGAATGWWVADRFSPRDAPELVVVAAPAGESGEPGEARVMPDLRGLSEAQARQVLHDVGLGDATVTVESRPALAETGTVVAQDPPASAPVRSGVILTLAAPAVVPDLVGAAVSDAVQELATLGAQVEVVRVFQPDADVDRVLAVEPPPGEPVAGPVVLTVTTPAGSVLLSELRPLEGRCQARNVQVDGVSYQDALRCAAARAGGSETVYLLNRGITDLTATVGQPDDATPGHQVRVEIVVDGEVAYSAVLGWGESEQVTVDTAGALRLTLRVAPVGEEFDRSTAMVFADPTLRGGPDDVAELRGTS